MNIKQAKDYIKQTVQIYLRKDEFNQYEIPVAKQRPVFLLGAPGVGKTAIMEQIAEELSVALVSYSMTHHTRQSALGLPFITHKNYNGFETDVTEYTMSEIISTIYETMELSGISEGILFLDEINCVSETLAPSMLQFLQYKVFGRHKVPEGWVIVTAGNPVEYNRAVREFDVAVMDRLKILEVEPDYQIFREYAIDKQLHPAIISFLDIKREYFYKIENTVSGRSYVTARGWEDLSEIIKMYEAEGITVEESLVEQYLRNTAVIKEFTVFYELYNKYKRDYHLEEIFDGSFDERVCERGKAAAFDERLSLLSMLSDRIVSECRDNCLRTDYVLELNKLLKTVKSYDEADKDGIVKLLSDMLNTKRKELTSLKAASSLSKDDEKITRFVIRFLEKSMYELTDSKDSFETLKNQYNLEVSDIKSVSNIISEHIENVFDFLEKTFENNREMLLFVTLLTVNTYTSKFISRHNSAGYMKYKDSLMLNERNAVMKEEIVELLEGNL